MKTVFLWFAFFSVAFGFTQNNKLFEQANQLYNQGNYTQAINNYETILQSKNHSAALYFNLANAHYKLNHIAPSIYYYEKALQLAPNDKEIKNNLAFAKNMTIDAIETVPEFGLAKIFRNITKSLTANAWAYLTVLGICLFVTLFVVYYFSQAVTKKRISFAASFSFLFLALFALFFAFKRAQLDQNNKPAIIFATETTIKTEPNLRSEVAFVLHEGTKVQILDTVNNWKKIKLSNGKTGWVTSQDIKAL